MRQIKLTIDATETHCGENGKQCKCLDAAWPRCDAFPEAQKNQRYDADVGFHTRLPECIAAEKLLADAPTEAQKERRCDE